MARGAFALGILAIGFALGRGDGYAFTAAIAAFGAGTLFGAIGMAGVLVTWVIRIERWDRDQRASKAAHVMGEV